MRWAILRRNFQWCAEGFLWSDFLQTGSGVFSCGCCGCSYFLPQAIREEQAHWPKALSGFYLTRRHLETLAAPSLFAHFYLCTSEKSNLSSDVLSINDGNVTPHVFFEPFFLGLSHMFILSVFVKNDILDFVFDTPTVWGIPVVQMTGV